MRYSEAAQGRVFVIRLEDGEILHETIERFAVAHGIGAATVIAIGCADKGSTLIVGPAHGRASSVDPMPHTLDDVHEIAGTGTLFPDDTGAPILHMHAACGRKDRTITGCVRAGVKTWQVLEVVVTELKGTHARRLKDETTGFKLLQP